MMLLSTHESNVIQENVSKAIDKVLSKLKFCVIFVRSQASVQCSKSLSI